MPLVTPAQYIKNLSKSVVYASADVMKDLNPAIADFKETNEDLFKDINYAIKDRKKLFSRLSTAMKNSKIYEAADQLKSSIYEDITTGKFYNPERKERVERKALGFDDLTGGDFDFNTDDFDMGGDDLDSWDIDDSDEYLADSIESTSKANAEMVSTTVAKASEFVVSNQRRMNEYNILQQTAQFNKISSFLDSQNTNISKLVEFSEKALSVHVENSKNFYEKTTALLTDIHRIFKEKDDIKKEKEKDQEKEKEKKRNKITYNTIMSSEGIPDIKEYFKNVFENIKNESGTLGSFVNMGGEDNWLLTLAAAPLEFIPKLFVNKLISENYKKSAEKLNKSISGFFSNVFAMFNDMKLYSENPILNKIGAILGVKNTLDKSINTHDYERGDMSWNGIAQKALTEVIPGYLAQLVSLQSGRPEKIFNYDTGKYEDINIIKKNRVDSFYNAAKSGSSDIRREMERQIDYFNFSSLQEKEKLTKDMDDFFRYFLISGRRFNPYLEKDEYSGLSGMSRENYEKIVEMFKNSDKGIQMNFAREMMEARDRLNKQFERENESVTNINRVLANGMDINRFDKNGILKDDKTGVFQKDTKGYSVFDYLNKITTTILEGVKVIIIGDMNEPDVKRTPIRRPNFPRSPLVGGVDNPEINKILERDTHLPNISENIIISNRSISNQEKYNTERSKRIVEGKASEDLDRLNIEDFTKRIKYKEKTRLEELEKERLERENRKFESELLGTTLSEKIDKIGGSLKSISKAPWDFMSKLTDRVDTHLYEIIFGRPKLKNKDEEGEEVDDKGKPKKEPKSFMDALIVNMKNSFYRFNDWLEENILTPMHDEVFPAIGRSIEGVFEFFGVDVKGTKKKIKEFFLGEFDEDGYLKEGSSLFAQTLNEFKDSTVDIRNKYIGPARPIRKIIRLIKEYSLDLTRHNPTDQKVLLEEIADGMIRWGPINSKDRKLKDDILDICKDIDDIDPHQTIMKIMSVIESSDAIWDDTLMDIVSNVSTRITDTLGGENALNNTLNKLFKENSKGRYLSKGRTINAFSAVITETIKFLDSNQGVISKENIFLFMIKIIKVIKAVNPITIKDNQDRNGLIKYANSTINSNDPKKFFIKFIKNVSRLANSGQKAVLSIHIKNILDEEKQDRDISVGSLKGGESTGSIFGEMKGKMTKEFMKANDSVTTDENTILENFLLAIQEIPKHDTGKDKVPYDNYLAFLHKNESVLREDTNKMIPEILAGIQNLTSVIEEREKLLLTTVEGSDKDTESMENKLKEMEEKLYNVSDSLMKNLFSNDISDKDIMNREYSKEEKDAIITNDIISILNKTHIRNESEAKTKAKIIDIFTKTENKEEVLNKIEEEIKNTREEQGDSLIDKMKIEATSMFDTLKANLYGIPLKDIKNKKKEKDKEKVIENKVKTDLKDVGKDLFSNFRKYLPKMGAGAITGLIGSSILGLAGGPLVWAGVGAGTALVKNSETANKFLFGETDKDGNFKEGLIGKKYIEAIEKYSPGMKKAGITGAALGLLPFVPFGPLGGIIGGVAINFVNKNEETQKALYGYTNDEGEFVKGIFSPRFKKFLEEGTPRAMVGGITGMLLSSIGGPFGIVGGTMIGAAVGMATKSQKFSEFLLGKEDENGILQGGLIGFFRDKAKDLTFFVKENMLKPVAKSIKPLSKEILQIGKKIVYKVSSIIGWVFENAFGNKFTELMKTYIFKPIGKLIGGGVGKLVRGAGNIIASPFRALEYTTHKLRMKQQEQGYGNYSNKELIESMEYLSQSPTLFRAIFNRGYKSRKDFEKEKKAKEKEKKEAQESAPLELVSETKETNNILTKILDAILNRKTKKDSNKISDTENKSGSEVVNELEERTIPKTKEEGSPKLKNSKVKINKKDSSGLDVVEDSIEKNTKTPNLHRDLELASPKVKKVSMLTEKGELPFKKNYKGEFVPDRNSTAGKLIKEEEDKDNEVQAGILGKMKEFVLGKDKKDKKSKEDKGGILGFLGGILGKGFSLLKSLPLALLAIPLIPKLIQNLPEILKGITTIGSKIVTGIDKIYNFIENIFGKKDSEEGEVEGADVESGVTELMDQNSESSRWKRTAVNFAFKHKIHQTVTKKTANVLTKTGRATANLGEFISKIFKNPKIVSILGDKVCSSMGSLGEKISVKLGKEASEGLMIKVLKNIAGPVAIGFLVYDIVYGMTHADELLQVLGTVPFFVRIVSGIVNMLNEKITLGLLPKKWLISAVVQLMPKDIQESIAEGQTAMKRAYEDYKSKTGDTSISFDDYTENYNKNNRSNRYKGTNAGKYYYNRFSFARGNTDIPTPEEYMKEFNIDDEIKFNNNAKYRGKYAGRPDESHDGSSNRSTNIKATEIANKIIKDSSTGNQSNNSPDVLPETIDPPTIPFFSQKDSQWKDTPFNNPDDTLKQTIGDSGCGPTVAAMAISGLSDNKVTPIDTAKYAIDNKLKGKDDGVLPTFMPRILGENNIGITELNNLNKTEEKDKLKETISSNKPAILMGQNGVYGKNKHYVISVGGNKDEALIHNPEEVTGGLKTNINNILSNTISAIIPNINGTDYTQSNSSALPDDSVNETGHDTQGNSIFDQLFKAAEILVKSALGMDYTSALGSASDSINGSYGSGGDGSVKDPNRKRFLVTIAKNAVILAKKYNVLASVHVAQALLESSWGESGLSTKANNLFGMKISSTWNGPFVEMPTTEWDGTKYIKIIGKFKKYNNYNESQEDHFKLISGKERYRRAVGEKDPQRCIQAIKDGNYATDPNYVPKIMAVIESRKLRLLDEGKIDEFIKVVEGDKSVQGTLAEDYKGDIRNINEGNTIPGDAKPAVDKMMSVKGQLTYSMEGPRNPDKGSADCSSTVNWAYKKGIGIHVGHSTLDQVNKGKTVDLGPVRGGGSNANNLKPGDLLFYQRSHGRSRPYGVGHVEMYIGNNQRLGHGGGTGPKITNFNPNDNTYIHAKRIVEQPIVSNNEPAGKMTMMPMGEGPSPSDRLIDYIENNKDFKDTPKEFNNPLGSLKYKNPLGSIKSGTKKIIDIVTAKSDKNYNPVEPTKDVLNSPEFYKQDFDLDNRDYTNIPERKIDIKPPVNNMPQSIKSNSRIEELLVLMTKALSELLNESTNLSIIVSLLSEGINIKNLPEEIRKNPDTASKVLNIINKGGSMKDKTINSGASNLIKSLNEIIAQPKRISG